MYTVYRPKDKSEIPVFTIEFKEILSPASQSDYLFIVCDL